MGCQASVPSAVPPVFLGILGILDLFPQFPGPMRRCSGLYRSQGGDAEPRRRAFKSAVGNRCFFRLPLNLFGENGPELLLKGNEWHLLLRRPSVPAGLPIRL
jgi:hypothetical protein